MPTKILELNFLPDHLPSTLEILETAKDKYALTAESLASLTESQLEWLSKKICINDSDYKKLIDFRTDLMKTIDQDLLSLKALQVNPTENTQDKDGEMICENKIAADNSKSNFYECVKTEISQKKTRKIRTRKKMQIMCL